MLLQESNSRKKHYRKSSYSRRRNQNKNSNEVSKVYDMTLAELADALTENLQQKWQALPKRATSRAWKIQQIVAEVYPAQCGPI